MKGEIEVCNDAEFHGIECIENSHSYGFEGCYNGNLNHPDPRPGHRIWLKKIEAEKLWVLFAKRGNADDN